MGFFRTPVKLFLSWRSLFVVSAFARRLCCCDPPWSGAENVIAKNGYSSGAVNYNVNDVNLKQTKITQQPWYLQGTQKKKFD